MIHKLSYDSTKPEDDDTLDQIAPQLWRLPQDQQVAVSMAYGRSQTISAMYEAYEPDAISFDYDRCPSRQYDQCIELIQLLSKPGKLALCRAILEYLAVAELAGKGEGFSTSDNFCTLPVLAANWEE